MFEEVFREIEAKKQAKQKRLEAMMPRFETEKEALKYAVRLANLQPGERVKAPVDDKLVDSIFVCHVHEKDGAVLLFYDGEKLAASTTGLFQIVLD